MSKDISVTSDGTIAARASGSPEEGGNLNNHIAFSVRPSGKRLSLSTGMGATISGDIANGIKLIGSTGIAVKAAGNVGVSAEESDRRHDSKYDSPLRPQAIGVREARQITNEILALKGGDIRKYTVEEVSGVITKHPNLLTQDALARFRQGMDNLDAMNTGRAFTPEVTGRIQEISDQLRDRYGISIPPEAVTSAGRSASGEVLRGQTLAGINDVATDIQRAIVAAGGVQSINNAIAEASASLPPGIATQRAVETLQRTVADTSATLDNITEQYGKIPSSDSIRAAQRKIDMLVKHDPTLDISAFVAGGVKTADAGAALVVQRAAHASYGNVDWKAGEGVKFHRTDISTQRIEVGTGEGALSFSPDTARKLNLTFSGGQTAVGGYAYVEREQVRWAGIDGQRKTTTAGLGASISKGLGGGNTGIVSVEAFDSRIHSVGPVSTPSKDRDTGIAVKGQITF